MVDDEPVGGVPNSSASMRFIGSSNLTSPADIDASAPGSETHEPDVISVR
ncbi:hypothetical protein ABZS59_24520 [Streptomyces flaveolus]|jgi:hypothetical protein